MKALPESSSGYYDKFTTASVRIKPFDPSARLIAREYLDILEHLLTGFDVVLALRGSTAFGIAGKGDIDLGIYTSDEFWENVMKKLVTVFGQPGNREQDYARFDDIYKGYEIEVILLKRDPAVVDKCLTAYLAAHDELLERYTRIKLRHAHSKREYQIEKDRFLRSVVQMIPEEGEVRSTR
jgi:hypothetical protein